ncbi:LemA family protein [Gemmatimonas sp.]|uniref:LemA family protein n=1 Tax=Gemmatimonas sp. TaxID=1962908 RepID=UPI002ED977DE
MFFTLILVVVVLAVYTVRRYNALQTLAHGVREAHANVMASMKKRLDLVNKLVDIAKGYADHEKLTHLSISANGAETSAGETATSGVLTQVMRMATQYPELKANAAYQQLMAQLDLIESDLQSKREAYNAMVRVYNSAIGQLPVSLYAKQLGFNSAPYFDVENADSLEKLRDFHNDDAEHLKQMFAQGTKKVADSGRRMADESVRLGKLAVEKGMEMSADMQQRHQASGAASDAPTDRAS